MDPFSGKPVTDRVRRPARGHGSRRINAGVAARAVHGRRRLRRVPRRPQDRFAGFYDPDEAAPTAGPYAAFPRYPGPARTRPSSRSRPPASTCRGTSRAATTTGSSRATRPASTDLFRAIAVGCLKVFPNAEFDPARFAESSADELFASFGDPGVHPAAAGRRQDRRARPRPPDHLQGRVPLAGRYARKHGFGYTPKSELTKSRRDGELLRVHPEEAASASSRSTRSPRAAARAATSTTRSTSWLRGELRKAKRKDQLVVAFGHHTLGTMDNTRTRRARGRRATRPTSRAATATRASRRRSTTGPRARSRSRRCSPRNPNVIAYVAGHTHANRVDFYKGRKGRGFWQINTASHIDWPEQSRADRGDGQPRRHAVAVRHAAGLRRPRRRARARARRAAFTDAAAGLAGPHARLQRPAARRARGSGGDAPKTGRRKDRNVELLLKDPR